MTTEYDRIQNRIDSAENFTSANPVLLNGELAIESDTRKIKFGDGITAWNNLLYSSSEAPLTVSMAVGETLEPGSLVNIYSDNGVVKVRNANASGKADISPQPVHGFVIQRCNPGDIVAVHYSGLLGGLSGLTPGANCYLSAATPGGITQAPDDSTGNIIQTIGYAVDSATVVFKLSEATQIIA